MVKPSQNFKYKKIFVVFIVIMSIGVSTVIYLRNYCRHNQIPPVLNGVKLNHLLYSNIAIPFRYINAKIKAEKVEVININIDEQKLAYFDSLALEVVKGKYKVLPKEQVEYTSCKVKYNNKKIKAKFKYTGGFADHFKSTRKSFRVKTKDPFLGANPVNFYNPECRGGVQEMLNHKMLQDNGNIVLKTFFANVSINKGEKKLYFVEEGYSATTIKNNERANGVIFKIKSNESNSIKLYDETSISLSEKHNLDTLSIRIDAYFKGKLKPKDLFHLEKFATLFSHSDLACAYHALSTSNLRFYYDFEAKKIEPIAREFGTNDFIGFLRRRQTTELSVHIKDPFLLPILSSGEFKTAYYKKINSYLAEDFIDDLRRKYSSFINEKFLILDASDPYFDRHFFDIFSRNIDFIRKELKKKNLDR